MYEPRVLEPHVEWRSHEVANPSTYTEHLSPSDLDELGTALRAAQAKSGDLLEIGKDDFPLYTFGERLRRIERELIDGRGFVLIRGLVGSIGLPYHSDGSDLVGLLCLQRPAEGGGSSVCNALAIHNDLVRKDPELAAALYAPQPYDFRGEQRPGGKPYYMMPVFSECNERLFVRYIRPYIRASQRHPETPRISELAERAMRRLDEMTEDPQYEVRMDFEPGDMQFINNYHVLHGRAPYCDDPSTGRVRHLKRLWLETSSLTERPPYFQNDTRTHWEGRRSISRLDRRA